MAMREKASKGSVGMNADPQRRTSPSSTLQQQRHLKRRPSSSDRKRHASSSSSIVSLANPTPPGHKTLQKLISRLRPSSNPSSPATATAVKMVEASSSSTPSKPPTAISDDAPPPTPTLDDIRPPVFESEELNDLFYGSSSSSAGSSQERSRSGIRPGAGGTLPRGFEPGTTVNGSARVVGGRALQKTRSSISFGVDPSTSKTPSSILNLPSRRVLSASMGVGGPGDTSSAGDSSSAEKARVGSVGVGWRGVKRGLGGSVVGRTSEASLDGGMGSSQEGDVAAVRRDVTPSAQLAYAVQQGFKSPLSASTASTSSTARIPLSRLTSSDRIPTTSTSASTSADPPSTTLRPLATLSSAALSAVTPGYPGRERLGASVGHHGGIGGHGHHPGAGAIGLSESSKRFRSAFRLTKPIGGPTGTAPRRAGRARPEDQVNETEEEPPSSSSATENEADADGEGEGEGEESASSPPLDGNGEGEGRGWSRQSSSPQALESAQLVPSDHNSQPQRPFALSSSQTVQLGRRPTHAGPGRRPSELDVGVEADSEPSPPPLGGLPPAPHVNGVAYGGAGRRGKMSVTRLDDLLLAPHSPPPSSLPPSTSSSSQAQFSSSIAIAPEDEVENQFGRSVTAAGRTKAGRAPLATKESVESLGDRGAPVRSQASRRASVTANEDGTATAVGHHQYVSQGRASPRGTANGYNLASSRGAGAGSSPVYVDGGSGDRAGGTTLRGARERKGSQATQMGRPAQSQSIQVARDREGPMDPPPPPPNRAGSPRGQPSPPTGARTQQANAGRRPLAEISRAAHYNARAQEAVVGEYQVPLAKESPPSHWSNAKASQSYQQDGYVRPPGSAPSGTVSAPTIVAPPEATTAAAPPAKKSSRNYSTVNGVTYARAGLLGKGGSSKVWRVLDNKNSIYALKVVTLSKGDHETYHSFVNEIKLLEQLKGHDRVIRLIDSEVDEVNKRLSLVMEIGDVDLNTLLTEQLGKPISMNFLRHIWEQMLQAVQVVHDADIVHTDLKPANFVLVKGNLKLIDFGIAKAIPNDTTNIARDSQIGTANYMSPEALSDSGLGQHGRLMKMGRATDVWALGCILYQMVYGHTPYSKIRPMHVKIMAIQNPGHVIDYPSFAVPINERGESQEHLKVAVGQDLIRVMKGCLRFDPKKRMTIPDLLQDPFLTGMPSTAAPEDDGMPHLTPALMSSMVSRVLQWSAGRAAPPNKEQQDHFVENLYHAILASQ